MWLLRCHVRGRLTLRCPVGFFFSFVWVSVSNAAEESVDICGSRASGGKTTKTVAAVAPVTVRLDFSQSDEFRSRVGSIVRKSANGVPHKSGMSFVCSRFSRPLSTHTSHALLGPTSDSLISRLLLST